MLWRCTIYLLLYCTTCTMCLHKCGMHCHTVCSNVSMQAATACCLFVQFRGCSNVQTADLLWCQLKGLKEHGVDSSNKSLEKVAKSKGRYSRIALPPFYHALFVYWWGKRDSVRANVIQMVTDYLTICQLMINCHSNRLCTWIHKPPDRVDFDFGQAPSWGRKCSIHGNLYSLLLSNLLYLIMILYQTCIRNFWMLSGFVYKLVLWTIGLQCTVQSC